MTKHIHHGLADDTLTILAFTDHKGNILNLVLVAVRKEAPAILMEGLAHVLVRDGHSEDLIPEGRAHSRLVIEIQDDVGLVFDVKRIEFHCLEVKNAILEAYELAVRDEETPLVAFQAVEAVIPHNLRTASLVHNTHVLLLHHLDDHLQQRLLKHQLEVHAVEDVQHPFLIHLEVIASLVTINTANVPAEGLAQPGLGALVDSLVAEAGILDGWAYRFDKIVNYMLILHLRFLTKTPHPESARYRALALLSFSGVDFLRSACQY